MKNVDLHQPSVAVEHAIAIILALTWWQAHFHRNLGGEPGCAAPSFRRSGEVADDRRWCGEDGIGYVPSFHEER